MEEKDWSIRSASNQDSNPCIVGRVTAVKLVPSNEEAEKSSKYSHIETLRGKRAWHAADEELGVLGNTVGNSDPFQRFQVGCKGDVDL